MNGPAYELHQFEGDYYLDVGGIYRVVTQNAPITLTATDPNNGSFVVNAASSVTVGCGPAALDMSAKSSTAGQVVVTGGPAGAITLAVGTPASPATVAVTPTDITLSIGPPGVGASLKLSPTAITLQIGETKLTLTPTGITEEFIEVKRALAATGHTLTAAESQVSVGVTGVDVKAPMVSTKADAMLTEKATLCDISATGVGSIKAGVLNIG